jgi:hypothetical protein
MALRLVVGIVLKDFKVVKESEGKRAFFALVFR